MHTTLITILGIIFSETIIVSEGRNMTLMMQKYPELGKNTVMFANGKMGYLSYPNATNTTMAATMAIAATSKMEDNVNYTLYTRDTPDGYGLKNYTDLPGNFDKSKKTIFVTHGWMSSGTEESCISIKDGFLKVSDVNVFVIDWSPIAGNIFYFTAKDRTKEVGEYYSKFLNLLINEKQMDPRNFHLIGHSLGAHVSGIAARGVTKGKIARVTGLDPALPGYLGNMAADIRSRLNKGDSDFVDVIHTCAGFLGFEKPIGHADFYPNGGTPPQPGCSVLGILETCSHSRSYQLFAESITLKQQFKTTECGSLKEVNDEKCNGTNKDVPMGEPTPPKTRGMFYLKTTGEKPYLMSS